MFQGALLITGGIALHLSFNAMFFIPSHSISKHPLNFWKKSDQLNEEKISNKVFAGTDVKPS